MALSDIEEMNQSSNIQTLLNWQQICFTLHNCVWQKKVAKDCLLLNRELGILLRFFLQFHLSFTLFPFPTVSFFSILRTIELLQRLARERFKDTEHRKTP